MPILVQQMMPLHCRLTFVFAQSPNNASTGRVSDLKPWVTTALAQVKRTRRTATTWHRCTLLSTRTCHGATSLSTIFFVEFEPRKGTGFLQKRGCLYCGIYCSRIIDIKMIVQFGDYSRSSSTVVAQVLHSLRPVVVFGLALRVL